MVNLFKLGTETEEEQLPTPAPQQSVEVTPLTERTLGGSGGDVGQPDPARPDPNKPIPQFPRQPNVKLDSREDAIARTREQRKRDFRAGGAIAGGFAGITGGPLAPATVALGGVIGALGGLAVANTLTAIEDFTTFKEFTDTSGASEELKTMAQEYLKAAENEAYYNFGGPVFFHAAGQAVKWPAAKIFGVVKNQAHLIGLLDSAEKNNVQLALFNSPSKLARFYTQVLGIFPLAGAGIRSRFIKQVKAVHEAGENFIDSFGPIVQIDKLGINMTHRIEQNVKSFRNVSSFFYERFFNTAKEAGNPRFIPTAMFKNAIKALMEGSSIKDLPKIPAFKNINFIKGVERRTVTLQKRALILERRAQRLAAKEDVSQVDQELLELDNTLKAIDDELLELKITQGPEGPELSVGPLVTPGKGDQVVSNTLENYLEMGEFITVTEFRALQKQLNDVGRRAGKDNYLQYVSTILRDGMESDLQNIANGFTPFRLAEIGLKPEQARVIMQSLSDANDFYFRGKSLFQTPAGKTFVTAVPRMFEGGYSNKIPTINPDQIAEKFLKDPSFRSPKFLDDLEELINFNHTTAAQLRKKIGPVSGKKKTPRIGREKPSEEYFKKLTRLYLEKRFTAATTSTVTDNLGNELAFLKADVLESSLGLSRLGGLSASTEKQSMDFLNTLFKKSGVKSVSVDDLRGLIDVQRAVFESPVRDPAVFAVRRLTLQGLRNPGNLLENLGQMLAPAAKIGAQSATTIGGVQTFGFFNFGIFILTVRSASRIITQPEILTTLVKGLKGLQHSPTRQAVQALAARLMGMDSELIKDGIYIDLAAIEEFEFRNTLDITTDFAAAVLRSGASAVETQMDKILGPSGR